MENLTISQVECQSEWTMEWSKERGWRHDRKQTWAAHFGVTASCEKVWKKQLNVKTWTMISRAFKCVSHFLKFCRHWKWIFLNSETPDSHFIILCVKKLSITRLACSTNIFQIKINWVKQDTQVRRWKDFTSHVQMCVFLVNKGRNLQQPWLQTHIQ